VDEPARAGYLQRRSVRPETRARYRAASAEVEVFARDQKLPCDTADAADTVISLFMDRLFFEGDTLPAGRLALYGFAWAHAFPTKGAAFPKAKQALKGWRLVCPPRSREPIPWAAVLIVASHLVSCNDRLRILAAALFLLCFDGYFRPSEALELRKEALCAPRGRAPYDQWGVIVRPRSLSTTPSKTGVFDDTVIVAEGSKERQWLPKVVAALHRRCRAENPIFDELSLPQIEKFMREANHAAKLDLSCLVPHGLRHGGPSHDALHATRTLEQIQVRGRWRAWESVRRYMKHGLLLRVTAQLSTASLRHASELSRTLGDDIVSALKQWPQRPHVQRPAPKTVEPDL